MANTENVEKHTAIYARRTFTKAQWQRPRCPCRAPRWWGLLESWVPKVFVFRVPKPWFFFLGQGKSSKGRSSTILRRFQTRIRVKEVKVKSIDVKSNDKWWKISKAIWYTVHVSDFFFLESNICYTLNDTISSMSALSVTSFAFLSHVSFFGKRCPFPYIIPWFDSFAFFWGHLVAEDCQLRRGDRRQQAKESPHTRHHKGLLEAKWL